MVMDDTKDGEAEKREEKREERREKRVGCYVYSVGER